MKKLLLIPLLLAVLLFCWHAALSYRKYNVILITTDTLRSDHLSCYNEDAPRTVNFDRLAAESVLFEQAYTTIPITLAAHTAILTSHAPHSLRLFNNGETYDGHYPLISKMLQDTGYKTAAFVSLGVLKGEFGLRDSFQTYEDKFDDQLGRYYKTADEMNALALPWIEKEKDHPFFAWIHYSDPHEPYVTVDAPPDTEVLINGKPYGQYCMARKEKIRLKFDAQSGSTKVTFRALTQPGPVKLQEAESKRFLDPKIVLQAPEGVSIKYDDSWEDIHLSSGGQARYFEGEASFDVINPASQAAPVGVVFTGGIWGQRLEEVRANYEAEVQYLDRYLGLLLDKLKALGLEDRTIIVLTSDHGEGLKTHGYLGHVGNLHNEVVHVPLLVHYPHLGRSGTRVQQLVNHLDIVPTLADLLHVRKTPPFEGASLKHYISNSPVDWLFSSPVKRERTYVETYTPEAPQNSFALIEGNMKLIFTPTWKWEIFDTSQDSMEKKNIARTDPARFQSESVLRLRNKLQEFSRESELVHGQRKNPQLDELQKEMLDSLGYMKQGSDKNSPPGEHH